MTILLRRTPRLRTGFTLIEVLVVVAIIALLVAILLPSLARARFQARIVACQANLHDLGTSCTMYANTYSGYFPLSKNSTDDNFFSLWKARQLKNTNVLICPATKNVIRPGSLKYPVAYYDGVENDKVPYLVNGTDVGDLCKKAARGRDDSAGGHSYEYIGVFDGSGGSPLKNKHKRNSQFRVVPTQMVLVFENDDDRTDLGVASSEGCTPSKTGNGNNCPQPWDNHGSEGMNMMFADGHAEWLRKMAGNWKKATTSSGTVTTTSFAPTFSVNALIDRALARSQDPWTYSH